MEENQVQKRRILFKNKFIIFISIFLSILYLVIAFFELGLRIAQTINPEGELKLMKQYPDYIQAYQIALMHGTNFKDLVMGMTFIYFAYFLTIN